jgi:hypothetical protein
MSLNTRIKAIIGATIASRPKSAGTSSRARTTCEASWISIFAPCDATVTREPCTDRRFNPAVSTATANGSFAVGSDKALISAALPPTRDAEMSLWGACSPVSCEGSVNRGL